MLTKYNVTYPFYSKAILPVLAMILGLSITLQYTAALFPTLATLVPLALAVGIVCIVGGLFSLILISPPKDIFDSSIVSIIQLGSRTGIITVLLLLIPSGLLFSTVLLPLSGVSETDGLLFIISSTAAVLLFLAAAYFLPITVVAVSHRGITDVAFDRSVLIVLSRELDYLTAWIVGFSIIGIGVAPFTYSLTAGDFFGVFAAGMASYLFIIGILMISEGISHDIAAR